MPEFNTDSHDHLQAVVAALCAVGAIGGPVVALPKGVASSVTETGRVEGFIWDIAPMGGVVSTTLPLPPVSAARRRMEPDGKDAASVYVTPGVVAQVNRVGTSQMQIALRGIPGCTKHYKLRGALTVNGVDYVLVLGDSHAAWRTHQDSSSIESFDQLFAIAAHTPGVPLAVSEFSVLDD